MHYATYADLPIEAREELAFWRKHAAELSTLVAKLINHVPLDEELQAELKVGYRRGWEDCRERMLDLIEQRFPELKAAAQAAE